MVLRLVGAMVASVLAAGITAAWAGEVRLLDPLPVSEEEAPLLFRQCSRQAPTPAGAVWLPSPEEIAALEADLAIFAQTDPAVKSSRISGAYRGQYAGFERDGVRLIYASYVIGNAASMFPDGAAFVVCDGGAGFWGIVYDPQNRRFSEFEVNGMA